MKQLLLLRLLSVVHISLINPFHSVSRTRTRENQVGCRVFDIYRDLDEHDSEPFKLFLTRFQESLDSFSFSSLVLSENNEDDNVDDVLKKCKKITARTIKVKKSDIMCQLTFIYGSYTQIKNLNFSESPKYIESLLKGGFKKANLATTKSDIELKLKRGRGKLKETLKVRIL